MLKLSIKEQKQVLGGRYRVKVYYWNGGDLYSAPTYDTYEEAVEAMESFNSEKERWGGRKYHALEPTWVR